jgi:hypothetical protein
MSVQSRSEDNAIGFSIVPAIPEAASQVHRLVCVLDLSCVEYVIENRSETAQLPESGVVKFHVGPPVVSR